MDTTTRSAINNLSPFNSMTENQLDAAIAESKLIQAVPGSLIFKRSTTDEYQYWLLKGAIKLLDANFNASIFRSDDKQANQPIDDCSPHTVSAVCEEDSEILTANKATLQAILENFDETSTQEETKDWMSELLSTPLFEFIPPKNIQTLFKRFEQVHHQKGDIIIRQNDPGDYFYAIRSGRVKVEMEKDGTNLLVAELAIGETFGQDALVSDDLRNATVSAVSACTLMRLASQEFEELLMEPVIEYISTKDLKEMRALATSKIIIVDLRVLNSPDQTRHPGSINIPLLLLRKNLNQLSTEHVYVTVGVDKPKTAELGAYLMNEKGFTTYVLEQD
ncbi:MAG: cyclic nucleotide-binding domain-containing protein [Gammaproteobacteria bacterium]|jgi:signal-transduction protein with cAMP-binding, CBS, and nucleotidyltransferase domain|nr:cyclic nucleotide-binding domain-containing protein [Gammaproteobacteria bacterium]MBT5203813.1 cyclic nucleotide-binding domain-containing protein [Gammaproteobacteria bacterium]MBT5603179.1 cyclic nucleotide-binding domain-containing protein [Gammaproteobacteria bacterium]